jgi:hypothetical protein
MWRSRAGCGACGARTDAPQSRTAQQTGPQQLASGDGDRRDGRFLCWRRRADSALGMGRLPETLAPMHQDACTWVPITNFPTASVHSLSSTAYRTPLSAGVTGSVSVPVGNCGGRVLAVLPAERLAHGCCPAWCREYMMALHGAVGPAAPTAHALDSRCMGMRAGTAARCAHTRSSRPPCGWRHGSEQAGHTAAVIVLH